MPIEIMTYFANIPVKIVAQKINFKTIPISQLKVPFKYKKVSEVEYLRMVNELKNI